jgi:pimeloyl-ACP methyl ester carboxylesterase
MDWVPAFEQAVARKNAARAMALVLKGLRLNWISRALPLWALALLARLLLRGDDGREMMRALSAAVGELRIARQLESQYQRYGNITAKTLLLGGGRSPVFLREVLPILAATILQASLVEFPGFDHNAPDLNAPAVIAEALKAFFAANPTG